MDEVFQEFSTTKYYLVNLVTDRIVFGSLQVTIIVKITKKNINYDNITTATLLTDNGLYVVS